MDLLESAVVDVTLLMVTARALHAPGALVAADGRVLRGRRRMRDELRRGAAAYLKCLLRNEESMDPADLLAACRLAAEGKMPRALAADGLLRRLMTHESGALEGFTRARHDLWRIARLAVTLRHTAATRDTPGPDSKRHRRSVRQLSKRLRKAVVGYVRTAARTDVSAVVAIAAARQTALDELRLAGEFAAAQAAGASEMQIESLVDKAIARGLRDLVTDWTGAETGDAAVAPDEPQGAAAPAAGERKAGGEARRGGPGRRSVGHPSDPIAVLAQDQLLEALLAVHVGSRARFPRA